MKAKQSLAHLMSLIKLTLVLVAGCTFFAPAHAHKPSDSYLTLTTRDGGIVDVAWHIALRDLDSELHLDANDDGQLSWGEVRTRWQDIGQFARPHLQLTHQSQPCTIAPSPDAPGPALITHTDGQYAVLIWRQHCPLMADEPWSQFDLDYGLFALSDPTHRGIVHWRSINTKGQPREAGTVVLGVPRPRHNLSWTGLTGLPTPSPMASTAATQAASGPTQPASSVPAATAASTDTTSATSDSVWAWSSLWRFIQDGVHHIAIGTDHILFLVSLLLVSVWIRPEAAKAWPPTAGWVSQPSWTAALGEVLRLVTAFTVAHSITLGLAAFGVLSPPSRWVESLIALSVLLAALDNLFPLLRTPRWIVVFGFGLVHGFGFAGALQDLGLSQSDLAVPLLGFNLGVELGQLALVAFALPIALRLRHTRLYRWLFVGGGSVCIALLAGMWLIERLS